MVRPFAEQIHIYFHGHKRKPQLRLESWGAFVYQPSPQTAQSQASLFRRRAEWLGRATGRLRPPHS